MRLLFSLLLFSLAACQPESKLEPEALRVGIDREPATLHPLKSQDAASKKIYSLIFESLLDFNSGAEPQAQLATNWKVSQDGLEIVFDLAKNRFWSDGQPLTAEDVEFSFQFWKTSNFPIADALRSLQKIEVLHPYQIRMKWKEFYYRQLFILGAAFILPKHHYSIAANQELLGSGPFQFEGWTPGQYLSLKLNPKYPEWDSGFERIQFYFIRDDEVAWQLLSKGRIDATDFRTSWKNRIQGDKVVRVVSLDQEASSRVSYIGWNLKRPWIEKQRIRQALGHAFPWNEIKKRIVDPSQRIAHSYFHPSRGIRLDPPAYNLPKARELLGESSFGFNLLTPVLSPDAERVALTYQRELKKIGVEMNIQSLEWATFLERVKTRHFDAYFMSWTHARDSDPFHLFHSEGNSNFGSYKNREVDSLLKKARSSIEPELRQSYFQELSQIVQKDMPVLFLFEAHPKIAVSRGNLDLSGSTSIVDWRLRSPSTD